jgi:hypothetical protein
MTEQAKSEYREHAGLCTTSISWRFARRLESCLDIRKTRAQPTTAKVIFEPQSKCERATREAALYCATEEILAKG